jgi:hypothetical protein
MDVFELDAGAAADQRRRFRMVAQLVRHQERRQRFRQRATCWVMSTSATARSRVACSTDSPSVQISTTSPVVASLPLPEHDRPGEQTERQNDGHHGVKDAQLLEIEQATPSRLHLAFDGGVETAMLA